LFTHRVEEQEDPAIISFQRGQATGVESGAVQATFRERGVFRER